MDPERAGDEGDEADVRRFQAGDAEAVRRLHERALREAGTDPEDVPGTQDLRWIEAAYIEPGGEFLVVEVDGDTAGEDDDDLDGQIVAMGGLVVDSDVAEVFRVAVHSDHQREGYGNAIMEGLENAARDRGVDRLALTTAARQQAATEFYPARGYTQTSRERHGEYELLRFEKRLDY